MIKKLRQNRKNKKGFTLVELIVVIVIILVLAAVLVPSVLRYVNRANQANCQADAASTLVDLQARITEALADAPAVTLGDIDCNSNITANRDDTLLSEGAGSGNDSAAQYQVVDASNLDEFEDEGLEIGDLVSYSFQNEAHFVQWTFQHGWYDVDEDSTVTVTP